jgi:hypothetical protein
MERAKCEGTSASGLLIVANKKCRHGQGGGTGRRYRGRRQTPILSRFYAPASRLSRLRWTGPRSSTNGSFGELFVRAAA